MSGARAIKNANISPCLRDFSIAMLNIPAV
jgi:hypothetical protein